MPDEQTPQVDATPHDSSPGGSPRPPRVNSTKTRAGSPPKSAPASDAPKQRPPKDRRMESDIASTYTMLGIGLAAGGVPMEVAQPFVMFSEEAAAAWMEAADRDPRIKKALESFMRGSVWAGLIGVHVKMAAPILSHYGMLPGGALFGPAASSNGGGPHA